MIYKYFLLTMVFLASNICSGELKKNVTDITEILRKIYLEQGYPGISLAISFNGELYDDQVGLNDIVKKTPVNKDTLFRVYSLTKGLTQILSRILSDNQFLDLNAPIKNYLPDLPLHLQEITSQQLLSHTSGIRHYRSNDEWLSLSQNNCSLTGDALNTFINDPLVSEVGAEEHYSSFGYVLLSAVLEAAAGQSFDQLITSHILTPSLAQGVQFDDPQKNQNDNVTTFYEPYNEQYFEAPKIDNSCKFGEAQSTQHPLKSPESSMPISLAGLVMQPP